MLDEPRQIAELCALERRVHWGGHEAIDHPQGGHDDAVNALAGAAVCAATVPARPSRAAMQHALALSRSPARATFGGLRPCVFIGPGNQF
jgi:hypothetical protein